MSTEITFPDLLQFGIRYQVIPALSLEFDFERTGWDTVDALVIEHASGLPTPYVETSNWNDVWTYRLGGIYTINEAMKVLFGYSYDNTPQGDDYFTPRLPDSDRQSFSLGIAYVMGQWAAEVGYMYVRLDERSFSSTSPPSAAGDPNGSFLYNGTYETYGNLFGFGVRYHL